MESNSELKGSHTTLNKSNIEDGNDCNVDDVQYENENLRIHWYLDCFLSERKEDTTYPMGLDVENCYKSRSVKQIYKSREQKKTKKDFRKENIQKLHRLRRGISTTILSSSSSSSCSRSSIEEVVAVGL